MDLPQRLQLQLNSIYLDSPDCPPRLERVETPNLPMQHLSQKCPVRLYAQLLNDFSVSAFEGEMFGIQTGLETFDLI